MMLRRALLGAAMLPLLAKGARAAPADLGFRVMREGAQIGTHLVRFRDEGDLLRARSDLRIQVRLAGFTVYRYSHETEEAWRDGRLVALESRSDRNGTPGACQARAEGAGLRLRGTAGEALLPATACPLTWWRAANLAPGVPLFDARDGRPVEPRLERSTQGALRRVKVIGGEGAEVLYDGAGRWVGFATTGEDGSAVTYDRA
jgi:hypothetical protein